MRGIRVDLRAVDRDHPDLHQPRLLAQREHRAEQLSQRILVADTEPRDRRVIGCLLCRDHAVGDILHAAPLDPPRGAFAPRIGIDQQRHHHRRLKGRPAPPILAVGAIKRRQIHLLNRPQHEPRQMVLRQPIPWVRRHQERLLTIARQEVHSHAPKCLNPPGRTGGLRDTHDDQQQRPGRRPLTTAFLRLRARAGHRGRRCRHLGWRRAIRQRREHRGQLKAGPHAGPP